MVALITGVANVAVPDPFKVTLKALPSAVPNETVAFGVPVNARLYEKPGQPFVLPLMLAVAGAVGVSVTLLLRLQITFVVNDISSIAKSFPVLFTFLSNNTIFANVLVNEFHVNVNCVQLPQAAVALAFNVPIEMPLMVASIKAGLVAESDCTQKLKTYD